MPHVLKMKDGKLLTPFGIRDLLDAVEDYAGEELRREIEEYIETNVEDIDDYEKEYDRMLSMGAVVCFCVYFYIQEINKLFNTYKDASGIWHEDRFRPLVVALTNLCLNLLMVNFWGIYGILLSTVFATLFVGMPWLLHNLFTTVFDKKYLSGFLINLGRYVAGVALVGVITYLICNRISFSNLWLTLVIRGLISCLIPNAVFWGLYHRLREFKECVKLVDKMTKRKFRLSGLILGEK